MTKSRSYGLRFKTLDKHPRVLEYDNEGTDDGMFILTLVRGYAFYDAAKDEGDDPQAEMACHGSSFYTVKEAIQRINEAKPCKCGRCLGIF